MLGASLDRNTGSINPADSLDGLTGQLSAIDFSKRKFQRERTLLASINDIKVSKVVELNGGHQTTGQHDPVTASPAKVKVWEKNASGKNIRMSPAREKNPKTTKAGKHAGGLQEEHPAANRQQEEFMQMGGKGDMQLFADDASSRYLPAEVPKGAAE